MTSWRETFAIWPALLAIGGAFATTQFLWSNFVGFELVDLVSAVASLVTGVVILKLWRPKTEWRFADDDLAAEPGDAPKSPAVLLTSGRVARAWMPFLFLTVTVLVWGLPAVKRAMDAHTSWKWEVNGLHLQTARGEALTGHAPPTEKDREKAVADIVPLSSTGTAVFLAAVVSGALLGLGPIAQARMLAATVVRLVPAIATIAGMLALGFVTKASGMDVVLGLAFTRTNPWLYPIFGTLLGWLGVALTGSRTRLSNVLFGNLQRITAEKLGLSPILMASANTTGGVMGKMIDAQSIVVAAAATGEGGKEGELLRAVIGHSIAAGLIGRRDRLDLCPHPAAGRGPSGALIPDRVDRLPLSGPLLRTDAPPLRGPGPGSRRPRGPRWGPRGVGSKSGSPSGPIIGGRPRGHSAAVVIQAGWNGAVGPPVTWAGSWPDRSAPASAMVEMGLHVLGTPLARIGGFAVAAGPGLGGFAEPEPACASGPGHGRDVGRSSGPRRPSRRWGWGSDAWSSPQSTRDTSPRGAGRAGEGLRRPDERGQGAPLPRPTLSSRGRPRARRRRGAGVVWFLRGRSPSGENRG